MIRELGSAIAFGYRMAFGLFATAAWLWLGAAFLELLQHAVEWRLGMFTPGDGIEPGFEHQARMGFGYLKVAAVVVCTFLVPRFLYLDRSWKRVLRGDRALFKGLVVTVGIFGLSLVPDEILYAAEDRVDLLNAEFESLWIESIGLLMTIPIVAIYPWSIGLIAGDHSMTFRRSISAMHRRWIWANLLVLCCLVPTLVPHFLLNHLAYGAPPAVMGTLLLLDSILVGFIALLFGSTFWTMYRFRVLVAQPTGHKPAATD